MIYIIKKSDMAADVKKITKARNFVIFNGTKSGDIRNIRTGDATFHGLIPDNSLFDKTLDSELRKEKIRRFFKKPQITEIFAAIAAVAIGDDEAYHDCNQMIVLKDKVYTELGKKFKKKMLKKYGISEEENDIVFLYGEVEEMKKFIESHKDDYKEAYERMESALSDDSKSNSDKAKAIRYAHMAFTDPSKKTKKRLDKFLNDNRAHIEAILNDIK